MDDLVPHPFASILFALVVGPLLVWQGFEENRPAKRSDQSLSRPATEKSACGAKRRCHSLATHVCFEVKNGQNVWRHVR